MKKGKGPHWYGGMEEMMEMPEDKMMAAEESPGIVMYEDCPPGETFVLAHSYVPWQTYHRAFPPREALMKGTLFPELWGVYPIPE